jgi:hypothetical protein
MDTFLCGLTLLRCLLIGVWLLFVAIGIPAIWMANSIEDYLRKRKRWKMEKQGYVFITHRCNMLGLGDIEVIDEIIPPPARKEKHESQAAEIQKPLRTGVFPSKMDVEASRMLVRQHPLEFCMVSKFRELDS